MNNTQANKPNHSIFLSFPEVDIPVQGIGQVPIPRMYTIRQKYDSQKLDDVGKHLRERMQAVLPDGSQWKGKRLAITVGSRGIPKLNVMVRTLCDVCKEWGAHPFIVPSMGSHGGATAQGQAEMLAAYHITEETMGVPILSSMEVVEYGQIDTVHLYCDKYAWEADGIIVFNKIKPHTDFHSDHESGLVKMIAIGLPNHKGASSLHAQGFDRFPELLPRIAEAFLAQGKVAFGVGMIQNAYDDICALDVCLPEDLISFDGRMLQQARKRLAQFKFLNCDVLIVDEIGKNISGAGCDPNVTGRGNSGTYPDVLDLKRLVILGVSEKSHHNGVGINLADVTTRRCLESIDWYSTWVNALTIIMPKAGSIPLYANTAQDAIRLAIRTCPRTNYRKAKIARVKNTLSMDVIQVSEALYDEIKDRDDVELISGPKEMVFDDVGNLSDIWTM